MKPSYEELEQKLVESQREFRAADATSENLQMKLEKMAAELQSVKAMNDCLSEELRGYESDGAFEGPKMHLLWWQCETPNHDAFLAEVRASALPVEIAEIIDSGDLEAILFATEYPEAEKYRMALYNFRTSRKGVQS